jgi:hypothetical protein
MTTQDLLKGPDREKLDKSKERCSCGHLHLLHVDQKCYGRNSLTGELCPCQGFVARGAETGCPAVARPDLVVPGRKRSRAVLKALRRSVHSVRP